MKVSVVIPAYNEEGYIGKCLQSLLGQKAKPDEIIVVDNNCTDKTAVIARNFGVQVVQERKQGMIYARNKGFDSAKYDIIARTDADTTLPKDWILKIKDKFKDSSIGAISGPAYYFRAPNKLQLFRFLNKFFFKVIKILIEQDPLFGPNMAIRKTVWEKVAKDVCLKDNDVHEDIDLALHLRKHTKTKFYSGLVTKTSFRRWLRSESYFKYLIILIKTLRSHQKLYSP